VSDDLGLSAGAKGISEGIKTGREAGREIGKNIEEVQKEAVDVAKERANARIRERREAEFKKERAIFKALEEYRHRKQITDEEYKLRVEFIKKFGTKEWDKVIQIKTEIEKIEKASNGEGFDFTHKAKFTSNLELQKGDKVFKGTKKSSISQKMRNRAYIASNEQGIDHDTYYENMGNKIIRYWDLVEEYLKDKT